MSDTDKTKENQILKAYSACHNALVRSILKMSVRQQDVDDILQETYLRVLHANEKSHIRSPKDYFFVVSRNLVLENLSRQSREITMEINVALAGVDGVPPDRVLHYREKFEMLNEALRALPEKKRRAILLRKFYGFTHDEIAKKMNVSISSVEKYIAAGIKQCRRSLNAQGFDAKSASDDESNHNPWEAGNSTGKE